MPPQHIDLSKARRIVPASELNQSSAALSNATHLNLQYAKKIFPGQNSASQTTDVKNKDAPFQPAPGDSALKAGAKAAGNLPSSFMNFVKGLGHALIHPIDTVTGIAKTAVGAASELGRKLGSGANVGQPTTDEERTFDAFKQALSDRYGSIDKAAKTFETDPFGAGADVLSLLEGGGALAGKTDLLHSYLSKVGGPAAEAVSKAGDAAGISKIVEAAKNAKIAPFAKKYNPEVDAMFDSEGIKAPLSAVTRSPLLQGGEAVLGKGMFGGKITDVVKNATSQLESKVNDLVSKVTPEKSMSEENLGKLMQKGLQDYEDNFKLTEGKIYDEFSKTYGKSNVYGMATKDALSTILSEPGQGLYKGINPDLQRLFSKITGANNPEVKELEEQINKIKGDNPNADTIAPLEKTLADKKAQLDKDLTFEELKKIRTQVGEDISRNPDNGEIKRLYGALSKDMESAVKKIGEQSPLDGDAKAATDALEKLNQGYQTGKAKIESRISQSMAQSNPEQIVNNLLKRNSSDVIKQVKEMVGPEKFAEVQKSFIRNLFEDSVTREKFDVTKIKKKLEEYDPETLDELMSPQQRNDVNDAITQLEKYKTMSDALKSGQKMASGSQTEFLRNVTSTGAKIATFGIAAMTGNLPLIINLSAEVGGEALLAKLFNSEAGRTFLTKGISNESLKNLKGLNLSGPQASLLQGALRYAPQSSSNGN